MGNVALGPKLEYSRLRREFHHGENARVLKFGTSGIRLKIGDKGFTAQVVCAATKAVAELILSQPNLAGKPMIVAYDTHYLSKEMAELTAIVLAQHGLNVLLTQRDMPTPIVSHATMNLAAAGSINITCSHNPPNEQGFKFNPEWAGPADKTTTDKLGARATAIINDPRLIPSAKLSQFNALVRTGKIVYFDPIPAYKSHLARIVDFDGIRECLGDQPIVVDSLFGASGGGLFPSIFTDHGINVVAVNQEVDHSFRRVPANPKDGKRRTDPSQAFMMDLVGERVMQSGAKYGAAADGDADRFGIVDERGRFITPNEFGPVVADHLLKTRNYGPEMRLHRTVPTSKFMDKVGELHGREVVVTGVGFKHPAELLANKKIIIGLEESAGLSIVGHTPEKDGMIAGALAGEIIVKNNGASLSEILDDLVAKTGSQFHTGRVDATLTPELKAKVQKILEHPEDVTRLAGRNVIEFTTIDGVEFILEGGSRILLRFSGTEPIVKIYGESLESAEHLDELLRAGHEFVLNA